RRAAIKAPVALGRGSGLAGNGSELVLHDALRLEGDDTSSGKGDHDQRSASKPALAHSLGAREEGRNEEHQEQEEQRAAKSRYHRPEGEAGFGDCPDDRRNEEGEVEPDADLAASRDQAAGNDEQDAGNAVIPAAANADELV